MPRSMAYCPGADEGQHLVVVLEVGELEPGRPGHGVQRQVKRGAQLLGQRRHLGPGRRPVETAHPDVDRMDRPAADQFHDRVPGLLQLQPSLHQRRASAIPREVERAGIAEEVGRVQQVDVQRVAFDPLSAVEQPAKIGDRVGDLDPAGRLDRQARAHLVRHRADPADARGDVGRLGVPPAAQQRLEEPGRLVDLQPHVLDGAVAHPHVHRALALDPGQRADRKRAVGLVTHPATLPGCRAARAPAAVRR